MKLKKIGKSRRPRKVRTRGSGSKRGRDLVRRTKKGIAEIKIEIKIKTRSWRDTNEYNN